MSDQLVRQNDKLGGADRIRLERERQKNIKLFNDERDDKYTKGELRQAAMCYETAAINNYDGDVPPRGWPWANESWRPTGILRCLEKAGSLYQAEIDRMTRKNIDRDNPMLLLMEERVKTLSEEIDRFLAPLTGDPNLARGAFAILNQLNVENAEVPKFLESGRVGVMPLYFDKHLRGKLAVQTALDGQHPSNSIMNIAEICNCQTGRLCDHRLEWLMGYLRRAHYNISVRLQSQFIAVSELNDKVAELEDIKTRLAETEEGKVIIELLAQVNDLKEQVALLKNNNTGEKTSVQMFKQLKGGPLDPEVVIPDLLIEICKQLLRQCEWNDYQTTDGLHNLKNNSSYNKLKEYIFKEDAQWQNGLTSN